MDEIAHALGERGWYVSDTLMPREICEQLLTQLLEHKKNQNLSPAGVGQGPRPQRVSEIRGDSILWIDSQSPTELEKNFADWLEAFRVEINKSLYLGIQTSELHYAFYPPSSGYQKHRDVFQKNSDRVLSFVLYLNTDWKSDSGGELCLFEELNSATPSEIVSPIFGRVAIFLSAKIPHQVNLTTRERFSVTGWLKKPAPTAVSPVF